MQAVAAPSARGLLMLDIDDVLCLSQPYGGFHVRNAFYSPSRAPHDLWERLFHPEAVAALQELMRECRPLVVITSSWLSILDREHFIEVFRKTGLGEVADSLHESWDAPQNFGVSRRDAIAAWLVVHHRGEPLLILDDLLSGESLVESAWAEAGHQILCEVGRGFHQGLLAEATRALQTPYQRDGRQP